ncbi:MAG: HD-GYP domain-containing protein, partial [Candidatus Acetothermia bacterium]
AVDVVRYEHERWDGSGYPEGLEGEDIPLGSRIVAVADVWNALRTKRPYRGPLSEEEAMEEIKEMAGVKLDPEVVDALLTVVEEGRVEVKK